MPRSRTKPTKDGAAVPAPRRKRAARGKTPPSARATSRAPSFAPPPVRPHTILIGGFDEAATHLARRVGVPVLADATEAMLWASDTLEQAVAERKIIGFVGEKGTGKTVAFDKAVPRHNEAERLKRARDARYEPERVVVVQCPDDADFRGLVVAIYTAAFDAPPIERVRGALKDDTVLLTETVDRLRDEHVAVIIIEEAEGLTDPGLRALRKLNSIADARAPKRYNEHGEKLAAGVGIILIGTYELDVAICDWNEDGHRTSLVRYVGGIAAADVPALYRRLLPAFDAGAEEMGEQAWARFVRQEVTHGFAMPIRFFEHHIRAYVLRMAQQCPGVQSATDLPFDAGQFSFTARGVRRPAGCRSLTPEGRLAPDVEEQPAEGESDDEGGGEAGDTGEEEA